MVENSAKCLPPDGLFGIQNLQNPIPTGICFPISPSRLGEYPVPIPLPLHALGINARSLWHRMCSCACGHSNFQSMLLPLLSSQLSNFCSYNLLLLLLLLLCSVIVHWHQAGDIKRTKMVLPKSNHSVVHEMQGVVNNSGASQTDIAMISGHKISYLINPKDEVRNWLTKVYWNNSY